MKARPIILFLALFIFVNIRFSMGQGDALQIYPPVQKITQQGEAFAFHGFQLQKNMAWASLVHRTPVKEMLSSEGLPLTLKLDDKYRVGHSEKKSTEADGEYDLKVTKDRVIVAAKDSVGLFYGLQTLRQLVRKGKIYPVTIHDFPEVSYRGVVEGFYGTPWSQKDRISQLKFYGRVKANTYIYGPKDDPYHSSHWRESYPPEQAKNIQKLVQVANAHFVHFVWAIHPGQDIKWNKEDRDNVLHKFEDMYKLGVRSFAVFFDDISGEGTDAHKQAALLNYLTDHFVKVKKDVRPLILTPTDYNKSWANPSMRNGYLAILGRELEPSIQIMWTGDHVMGDVTKSTLDWVKKRIQRPALFWWNFPVSDYARNQLFIGPSYGLKSDVKGDELAGVLSNPMEHAEASKPAISGVADYGWNMADYNAENSWKHTLKVLLPHSYKAYEVFGENNSNPNHGLSTYVGKESKNIAPYLTRLEEGVKADDVDRNDFIYTEGYFLQIKQAGSKILQANDDTMLTDEVKPWLENFTSLGKEGLRQLENYKYHRLSAADYWQKIVANLKQSDYWEKHSFKAGDGHQVFPVTGTRALRPFVIFLRKWNSETLFEKISPGLEDRNGLATVESSVAALEKGRFRAVNADKMVYRVAPKPVKLSGSGSLTIALGHQLKGANVVLDYKAKKEINWDIQTSTNGEDWTSLKGSNAKGEYKGTTDRNVAFLRIKNGATREVSFQLNKLTLEKGNNSEGDAPFTTHDDNLLTSYRLTPGHSFIEKSNVLPHPKKAVILTSSHPAPLRIAVQENGGWHALSSSFNGAYIEVPLPEGASSIRVTSDQDVDIYEVLWE